mmetsp:Transcript_23772/g.81225  ORF Transcript_23772/g.81225 Transcript_23772/m.81225 type:complete len:95 (+) Transcript_23772:206-490(+)
MECVGQLQESSSAASSRERLKKALGLVECRTARHVHLSRELGAAGPPTPAPRAVAARALRWRTRRGYATTRSTIISRAAGLSNPGGVHSGASAR